MKTESNRDQRQRMRGIVYRKGPQRQKGNKQEIMDQPNKRKQHPVMCTWMLQGKYETREKKLFMIQTVEQKVTIAVSPVTLQGKAKQNAVFLEVIIFVFC